jgi:hypothetical protein
MQENLTFLLELRWDFRNLTYYIGKLCRWETLYMVINIKLFQNNVQPLLPCLRCPLYDIQTDGFAQRATKNTQI